MTPNSKPIIDNITQRYPTSFYLLWLLQSACPRVFEAYVVKCYKPDIEFKKLQRIFPEMMTINWQVRTSVMRNHNDPTLELTDSLCQRAQ